MMTVELGEFLRKAVPLAVNSAGRARFTTFYNPERVILVVTILYCIMLLAPLCVAFRPSCLVYSIQSQGFPMINRLRLLYVQLQKALSGQDII